MARKVITTLVSDLSGKEATETVHFSIEGKHYRMDLTPAEKKKFTDLLATYTEKAQKAPKPDKAKRANSASDQGERARIREWAQQNGYEVGDRGRIAKRIREAYFNAQA